MKIFALDCAKKTGGVAISVDGKLIYESYVNASTTHSETLLAMCDAAFSAVKLAPCDIDLFAVTAGPGSFTGLRIGIALIKGFAFANNIPCAPVSSLEALAQSVQVESGVIATALDARRQHVYGAIFIKNGAELTRITEDDILPCEDFAKKASEVHKTHKIGVKVYCIGDGAHMLAGKAENMCVCDDYIINGRAFGICKSAQIMHSKNLCVTPSDLTPIYLRPTLAERNLNGEN